MKNMWMVRAGKDAFLIDEFEKRNIVALGWGLGDLEDKSSDDIKRLMQETYPDESKYSLGIASSQVIKFRHMIKKGDYVLSYNPSSRKYLVGEITSDYYYSTDLEDEDIDYIGVTYGPGLVGALLVGVAYAKALAYSLNIPIVPTNHMHGHIAANYISHPDLSKIHISLENTFKSLSFNFFLQNISFTFLTSIIFNLLDFAY